MFSPSLSSLKNERPLMRTKLQNQDSGLKTSKQLVTKGYKYLSRAVITGESSISLLKRMHQSKNLKTIMNLEFDP